MKTFNWMIAKLIQNMGLLVMVANGLMPDNIKMAVGGIGPWGMDMVGGMEVSPRVKDHDKVQLFIGLPWRLTRAFD
jgi:phosphoribosylanthranilate isomerase